MKRPFAIALMIIAWLLYGAMPTLAECPICDSAVPMSAEMAQSPVMEGMSGMSMHGDGGSAGHRSNPCAGDMAHVAFCAACLILPPSIAIDTDRPLAFSYPTPGLSDPLHDNRPVPLAPPPRLA